MKSNFYEYSLRDVVDDEGDVVGAKEDVVGIDVDVELAKYKILIQWQVLI
jgi:hypothetical protein